MSKNTKNGNKAPIPLALIIRLFQLVAERKFTEAERILERIDARMARNESDEFNSGYLQALKGIILSHRTGENSDSTLATLDLVDAEALKVHQKEFRRNAEHRLHGDYDRGYFSALSEYVRVLLKTAREKPGKVEAD